MSFSVINNIDLNMSIMVSKQNNDEDFIVLHELGDDNIDLLSCNKTIGNFEQIIYVDFGYFIKDIRGSFKDVDDICKQFDLDIGRCNVYINKHRIGKRMEFEEYLYKHFNNDLVNNIIMLTTQALMGLPFEAIHNNIPDGYNVCELGEYKEQRPYRISIIVENSNIEFKAYKEFRIIKVGEDVENICKLSVKLEFDMNKSNDLLISVKVIG